MVLIKKLLIKKNKYGTSIQYGLFSCPYCLQEVIKQVFNGGRDKSCGCKKDILIGNTNRSRKRTEESKRKQSESRKGIKASIETKQLLSKLNKNRKHTEETKQNMSKASKGKKKSEQHKQNISKSKKGKFIGEKNVNWNG